MRRSGAAPARPIVRCQGCINRRNNAAHGICMEEMEKRRVRGKGRFRLFVSV